MNKYTVVALVEVWPMAMPEDTTSHLVPWVLEAETPADAIKDAETAVLKQTIDKFKVRRFPYQISMEAQVTQMLVYEGWNSVVGETS